MTCPDWHALTADGGTPVPAEAWQHAERCSACREAALAADPTLIFHRLPVPEVSAHDVAAMRQAVAAMRRDRALDTTTTLDARVFEPRRRARPARGRASRYPRRVGTLAAGLLLAMSLPPLSEPAGHTNDADTRPAIARAGREHHEPVPSWLAALVADEPLVDGIDGRNTTQIDTDDLSLVVVSVDDLEVESFDV